MIANPYETTSDSFYFVQNKLIMHNKASFKYVPEDRAQAKKSYHDRYAGAKGAKKAAKYDSDDGEDGGAEEYDVDGSGGGGSRSGEQKAGGKYDEEEDDDELARRQEAGDGRGNAHDPWSKEADYY
eukprot:jgi/Undpi1/10890/HiC_scaffold_3.g01416.m1